MKNLMQGRAGDVAMVIILAILVTIFWMVLPTEEEGYGIAPLPQHLHTDTSLDKCHIVVTDVLGHLEMCTKQLDKCMIALDSERTE